jgi:YidC/Oxa1 family membrane protein insertase
MFDRAVDLGFLYFITKPIFLVLNYFYKALGNFGLAIMLLTVITKVLLFPLAYKSAKSMNKIKKIQPKINKLKEQYVGNTVLFQQALVALYKKEKVNPAAGCLPIILQMPIFFALYKVLYVTIEMRHAPFFWWITDLSAPDSTTFFNLFGLIPWQPPLLLMVGILPVLMSLTMYIQQQMNPQPTDSTQAMVMKMMPLFLLFMFAQFPSGLLIYWTWSNIISIIQQMVIKYMPE